MQIVLRRTPTFLLAALVLVSVAKAENWPQFRGPTGLGYTAETTLPTVWGGTANEHVLWKTPIVGEGHASPIVWNDSVFVCTALWPESLAAAEREKVVPEQHVACYRVSDGHLQWDTSIPAGPWVRKDFRSGPGGGYAAPTPATDGKLVYCVFGSSVIAALDFQGHIVWRQEILPYTFDVTIGGSPVLYEDTVLFFCPSTKTSDSRVVALDKATGAEKWRASLDDMSFAHSTPVIIQVDDKPQLLVLGSGIKASPNALRSLDPTNGKLIWWCRGAGDAASPAYGAGIVYFDSGRNGQGIAVDPHGTGDLSKNIRWTINQVPEGIGSPIIVGQHVYRLHNPGVIKCWSVADGSLVWSERLDGLSTTWASPIADPAGHVFFANAGKSFVIQDGGKPSVIATNDLGDGNHPSVAVADGKMFLLGSKNLFCVGEKK